MQWDSCTRKFPSPNHGGRYLEDLLILIKTCGNDSQNLPPYFIATYHVGFFCF